MKCWMCGEMIKRGKHKVLDHYSLYARYHWVCDVCYPILERQGDI